MLELSTSSKTFIVGEYVALKGGPALLACTSPRFTLSEGADTSFLTEFCKNALIKEGFNEANLSSLYFEDPHTKKGGFGASSAELLLAFSYFKIKSSEEISVNELFRLYRKATYLENSTHQPSGYDFLAQIVGGIAFIHASKNILTSYEWPFQNLKFYLVKNNSKKATHEHLKSIGTLRVRKLEEISAEATLALQKSDDKKFVESINSYYQELLTEGLVHDSTQKVVSDLMNSPDVLAAKGCGALGADTVFVLTGSQGLSADKLSLLDVVATEKDISAGLQYNFPDLNLESEI